jgi:hypothetical protein
LATGEDVRFAPHQVQRFAAAAPADLAEIEISPSGYGLYFPRLDVDAWLPALLAHEQE